MSRWILFRMRNVSERSCRENQNNFIFSNFFSENRVVYEIMRKNTVGADRLHMTVWWCAEKMRFTCWITKIRIQTHTHNICVTPHVLQRILNINCFSTATVVTRTHLSVTFIRTLPLLFFNRLFDFMHYMNAKSVRAGFLRWTLCVWLRHNSLPCKSSDLFGRLQERLTLEVLVLLNPGIFSKFGLDIHI